MRTTKNAKQGGGPTCFYYTRASLSAGGKKGGFGGGGARWPEKEGVLGGWIEEARGRRVMRKK